MKLCIKSLRRIIIVFIWLIKNKLLTSGKSQQALSCALYNIQILMVRTKNSERSFQGHSGFELHLSKI